MDFTEMVSVHDGLGHFPLHWETEGPEEGLELDDEDLFAYLTDEYMAARIEYIFEMLFKHNRDSVYARDDDVATLLKSACHEKCFRTPQI
ncbi:hypothetical protein F66182_12810 [Fusarium sp. NRRL 66182]|nr:hypothetical protein F66182_12810 [Fusarium sp. NRRL 66182]